MYLALGAFPSAGRGKPQGFGGYSDPASAEALDWEKATPSRTRLSGYPTIRIGIMFYGFLHLQPWCGRWVVNSLSCLNVRLEYRSHFHW